MKYKIATKQGVVVSVIGRPIELISGIKTAIRHNSEAGFWGTFSDWEITELSTGSLIARGMDRDKTIQLATDRLNYPEWPKIKKRVEKKLRDMKITLPLNT